MIKKNKFSTREIEALRIVYEDLKFIQSEWKTDVSDDTLRRNSTILRQLLVDEGGLLQKVSLWLNIKIKIQASPNILLDNNIGSISYYSAGGGKYKGASIQSQIVKNYAMTKEEIKESSKKPRNKAMSIQEFLETPTLIIDGEKFNRIEIIKFIANKSGGTHFELNEKKLARMRHLENAKNNVKLLDKNAPYFELLSTGQIIAKSKYTKKLMKFIKNII